MCDETLEVCVILCLSFVVGLWITDVYHFTNKSLFTASDLCGVNLGMPVAR